MVALVKRNHNGWRRNAPTCSPWFMKSEAARDGCGVANQSRLSSPIRLTACADRNEMPASGLRSPATTMTSDSSRAAATAAPRRCQRLTVVALRVTSGVPPGGPVSQLHTGKCCPKQRVANAPAPCVVLWRSVPRFGPRHWLLHILRYGRA